jgi:hypothetical protein
MRRNSAGALKRPRSRAQRPAQHHHHDRRGHPDRLVEPEDLLALGVRDHGQHEQRQRQRQLPLRAAGALGGLHRQDARAGRHVRA